MTIIATYPDFKTVTVSVDAWNADATVEAFMELGALFVTTKQGQPYTIVKPRQNWRGFSFADTLDKIQKALYTYYISRQLIKKKGEQNDTRSNLDGWHHNHPKLFTRTP